MKQILSKYPIHSFLIVPNLIIFIYSQNSHLLKPILIFRPLIISLLISTLILLFAYVLLKKNITKAGIWASCILFLFSIYGFIYDYLELLYYQDKWPFSNIHRYLILSYIVLIISSYFFIRYSKYIFYNFTLWLNILLPSLVIFNFYQAINFSLSNTNSPQICDCSEYYNQTDSIKKRPDVYYFILDGFANRTSIEKYYKFKFDTFFNFLQQKGFFIANESFANYFFTPSSLSATLNMNYLDSLNFNSVSNNLVFRIFKSLNYKIYNISSGYIVTNFFACGDINLNKEIINEYERIILKYSVFRLDDLLGIIPYFRVRNQLQLIKNFNFSENSPKLVFAHIVCPHPPYVFNKNGKLSPTNSFTNEVWEPKNAYIEQLEFIGKEMIYIINKILKNYCDSSNQPIIIVQSDHGPFFSSSNEEIAKYCRTHILNAMYISNKDSIYKNISAVNTFRYIFRYEYGLNIPLIKDSIAGLNDLLQNRNFKEFKRQK